MDKLEVVKRPSMDELELLQIGKELEKIEVQAAALRRRIDAIRTGNRIGKGPKVVTIDMGNGRTRVVKCGTLDEKEGTGRPGKSGRSRAAD
jgi:hypothetical protein